MCTVRLINVIKYFTLFLFVEHIKLKQGQIVSSDYVNV